MSKACSEMREKVALSIAKLMGHDNWRRWTKEADAVILAVLEELSENDLPEEAAQAADDVEIPLEDYGDLTKIYGPEYRAANKVLLDLFRKEIARP